jgi:hypothetical protein
MNKNEQKTWTDTSQRKFMNKHMKRCSVWLILWGYVNSSQSEILILIYQNGSTLKFSQCQLLVRIWSNWMNSYTACGTILLGKFWKFLLKLNTCLLYDLVIYIARCLLKRYESILPKKIFFFFFGGGGTGWWWTHCLLLARQALYHLSHISNLLCFSYFSKRVSSFCQGWLGLWSSYLYHRVAGITDMKHYAYLWRWDLTNFLPGLA